MQRPHHRGLGRDDSCPLSPFTTPQEAVAVARTRTVPGRLDPGDRHQPALRPSVAAVTPSTTVGRFPVAVHSRRRPPVRIRNRGHQRAATTRSSGGAGLDSLTCASPIGSWPRPSTAIGCWSAPGCCRPMRRAAGIWGSTARRRLRDHDAAREERVTDGDGRASMGRSVHAARPAPDRCRLSLGSPGPSQVTRSDARRNRRPSEATSCSVACHGRAVRGSVMSIGAVARREFFASLTDGARK
jgi:hypothetical protein